jgi:tetratricopeptide (TPR) repeat protein
MKRRDDYPERTIITTWQISFDEVQRRDIRAAKLLQLWGYLDNQELWYQLLKWPGWENDLPDWLQQIAATEISFLAAVGILLDFSLVEQNDNSDSYSMHAVVHDWIQASIQTRTDNDFLQTAMTTIGLAVPPENTGDFATIQRRLLPHLAQLLQFWDYAGGIQNNKDNAVYLCSLHMLGSLCADQDKLDEAEQIYQRALQGKEKAWGPEHTSTLDTVKNLAILYKTQGKLNEAEQMYQRALQGKEKAWGPEHTSTLYTVNNLANLYKTQGKLDEAEQMYQRALQGKEKAWGPKHTSTLNTVNNLAILYKTQGKLDKAEQMYQRAQRS